MSQLGLRQPAAYAMHAHVMPSSYLDRVASTKTITEGQPLRERAERMRTPLLAPDGALSAWGRCAQNRLTEEAAKLAEGFQRSSSHGEGRNRYFSLRSHARRGRDHPRKRA